MRWGRDEHGWRRLLVPTFFCQDVVRSLGRELPLAAYVDGPLDAIPTYVDAEPGDVVLLVNFYGLRAATTLQTRAVVVEDHSHDIASTWAATSAADYALASLRKTLPLPDGGILWSPRGRAVPRDDAPSDAHVRTADERLYAMVLKRHYLDAAGVEKAAFRRAFEATERAIGDGDVSGISSFSRARLATLPVGRWREQRESNGRRLVRELADVPGLRVLASSFAVTLVCASPALRDALRAGLIDQRIYPAVLWPLEGSAIAGVPDRHLDLSRRVLTVHCDFRYSGDDMRRVAFAIRRALAAAGAGVTAGGRAERRPSDPLDPP